MNLQGNSNLYPTNVDFAKIFNSEQLGQIIGNRPKMTFEKGAYIFLPDEKAEKVYFLTEGKVKIGNYGFSPELMMFLMKTIGSRKVEMERRLESLYFKNSRARIIEFLYNFSTQKGERVGFETVVRRHMTHQEIANLTATSRQTVTTVLNELRSRNIITFNRRRFLIRNMETLGKEGRLAV